MHRRRDKGENGGESTLPLRSSDTNGTSKPSKAAGATYRSGKAKFVQYASYTIVICCLIMVLRLVDARHKVVVHVKHRVLGNKSPHEAKVAAAAVHKKNHFSLKADNMVEVDLPIDVLQEIYHDYTVDVKPHLNSGKSTKDFCLVSPYNPATTTWGSFVKEAKSDIKWYSVNNEATYQRYLNHVHRLGLLETVKEMKWTESEPQVYSMFLITRSFSKRHEFHLDWSEEVGTQIATFLIPLKDFRIGMAYKDEDDKTHKYKYQLGKAAGVAGGLWHSTGKGEYTEEENDEDVLLCVYVGSDDPDIWDYALENIADELEHYQDPVTKSFVRNENLNGKKSKCQ